jgi:ABC-type Fe3+/spermidine/putrescine transport system ATPase subunit
LVKELGITALFVTHDQEEAFDLSDRIAVMNGGRIRQIGTPRQLYERPEDRFVASFVGRANAFSGVRSEEGVRVADGIVWPADVENAVDGRSGSPIRAGEACVVLVRPEDLELVASDATDGPEGSPPALGGMLRDRRFRGSSTVYRVEVAGARAVAVAAREGEVESTLVEVMGPADGPGVGGLVGVRPRRHARFHVFSENGGL